MRKWLVGGISFALLLASLIMALVGPWPCRVNRATFERIKEGMTQEEVHTILGGPPGEYLTRPPDNQLYPYPPNGVKTPGNEYWYGDEGQIEVAFQLSSTTPRTVTFAKFAEEPA